ncbi:MAG: hypothetical protein KGI91_00050 [Burkholderiales bacterium]|nr:hypothetical protein [Burkholderiales bacterium]
MKAQLSFGALLTLPVLALAGEQMDSSAFYDAAPGQVFRGVEAQALTVGTLEGDETPYLTAHGTVSGKALYLELHGASLRLQIGRRTFQRQLERAYRPAGTRVAELDSRGTSLYIKSDVQAHNSTLCLESLPAFASGSTFNKSVFVILDSAKSPRVYQLPPLFASCRALVARQSGAFEVPIWSPLTEPSRGYQITYFRLDKSGLVATKRRLKAEVSESASDQFTFTEQAPDAPPAKPDFASQTIERGESCLHLSGEFGGDRSARDKELTAEMTRLSCGTVVKSLKRLKSTLPKDSRQLTEVNELLKAFE